jgi:hypothetical protein
MVPHARVLIAPSIHGNPWAGQSAASADAHDDQGRLARSRRVDLAATSITTLGQSRSPTVAFFAQSDAGYSRA